MALMPKPSLLHCANRIHSLTDLPPAFNRPRAPINVLFKANKFRLLFKPRAPVHPHPASRVRPRLALHLHPASKSLPRANSYPARPLALEHHIYRWLNKVIPADLPLALLKSSNPVLLHRAHLSNLPHPLPNVNKALHICPHLLHHVPNPQALIKKLQTMKKLNARKQKIMHLRNCSPIKLH